MRRTLGITAALAVTGSLCCSGPAAAVTARPEPPQTAVWTATSSQTVFPDALPGPEASRSIQLHAARNEYEAAQILIRKDRDFTIRTIDFGTLHNGGHSFPATDLSYRFVDQVHLNHNSVFGGNQPVDLITRKAPADFPDGLSAETTRQVPADTAQSIWIKAYIPKGTVAGSYTGTATVRTDQGDSAVPVGIDVENVTIPDAADSGFTTSLWSLTTGALSWDEGAGDTIELFYGEKRYSRKWWQLMHSFAADMKEYRNNDLTVNIVRLLLDGGSTLGTDGKYTFDWSRFDQYIRFFLADGAVKRLEGFWMSQGMNGKARQTEIIGNDDSGKAVRSFVDWDSARADNWIEQFIPALEQHLQANGWSDRWWMHIGDEPAGGDDINAWTTLAGKLRGLWPQVRLADAIFDQNAAQALAPHENFLIANELAHDPNAPFYDDQVAHGKPVWLYNCNIPIGMYLNRFIDQPVYDQRLTMWYAFEHGVTGYLHWAFNNWQYKIDDQDVKGDGYIVRPDKKHNTIDPTLRYESLRDGLEDYELLSIVKAKNPKLAQGLAHSLVTRANRYSRDTAYMQRMRSMLLAAAAGKPVTHTDLARGRTIERSTVGGKPALTVDLGSQAQLDAVTVAGADGTARIQVSYDGRNWADAYSGPVTFAGLNTKGRYVRVVGTGTGLAVAGSRPALKNLAGGRAYTISPLPTHPDAGRDSTDGVLAGHYSDGRSYGFDLAANETATAEVTVDLRQQQDLASLRIHRYEDYEQRYSPDDVTVAVSADGTHFVQKGRLRHTNGPDGLWYVFDFPAATARYLRVSYEKTYAAGADALFLDEIEAYGPEHPGQTDVAAGRPYTKSAEPDDPMFVDTANAESTDGVISGDLTDRYGYAYYLGGGQTRTVSITVDLGSPIALDRVLLRKYDDGAHDYAPDSVSVYTRADGADFQLQGKAVWATGSWFDVSFPQTVAGHVRIDLTKSDAALADYMFVDEIAVMGDLAASPVNLAAGRPYIKSGGIDPHYPDTDDAESTDGIIAGGYPDGRSYGYVLSDTETRTVDIDVDLGDPHPLQLVKFWRYNDGVHHYEPDVVTVYTSDNGTDYVKQASVTTPDDRWFSVPLDVTARFVRVEATKKYGYFADYIFVDEIEIYGT